MTENNSIIHTEEKTNNDTASFELSSSSTKSGNSIKQNNRWVLVATVFVLIIIVIGVYYVRHNNSTPNTTISSEVPAQVTISKTAFVPSTITIKVNQAVVWTNTTYTPHIVASDPYPDNNNLPSLNSKKALTINENYSYIFTEVGTYTYHDNLNPYTIKGTVIVKK